MIKKINFFSARIFILHIFFQICMVAPSAGNLLTPPNPLDALNAPPLGVDPKLMDAERNVPISTDGSIPPPDGSIPPPAPTDSGASGESAAPLTGGPNLEMLWNCKRNPTMSKEKCANEMQLFCSGYCTRLNCAILTNRTICLDVCNASNPMMAPCVSAGKRNILKQHLAPQTFPTGVGTYPPGYGGMGMNPMMGGMGMMGMNPMMGAAAMAGSALGQGVANLFGGGDKNKNSDDKDKKTSSTSDADADKIKSSNSISEGTSKIK